MVTQRYSENFVRSFFKPSLHQQKSGFGMEISSDNHRQRGAVHSLNWAGEPAGGEAQGDHNKDDIENEHDAAHGLGHLPVEGEDGDEDQHEHEEEHANVAAHA